jgi:hypothetical protein
MGMRVLIVNADEGGCGWYRLFFPGRVLANEIDFELATDESFTVTLNKEWGGGPNDAVVTGVELLKDYDVVIFQRPLNKVMADVIPMIQAQGVAVVVELDDDFWHIRPPKPSLSRG